MHRCKVICPLNSLSHICNTLIRNAWGYKSAKIAVWKESPFIFCMLHAYNVGWAFTSISTCSYIPSSSLNNVALANERTKSPLLFLIYVRTAFVCLWNLYRFYMDSQCYCDIWILWVHKNSYLSNTKNYNCLKYFFFIKNTCTWTR